MTSENTVYAFLDTNTVLHFKRPDLVDWRALLGSTTTFIVATPVLVRELEHQKIHNRSRKLRERAQSLLSWLSIYVDRENASEIRSGIHLIFIRHSPSINFEENKLSRLVSDDELIASALEFMNQNSVHVVLLTADLGLRMKLPAHKLKGVAPSEADRLPDEPDEAEKELIQSRKELARYTSRVPKLELTFQDDKQFSEIRMIEPGPLSLPGLPSPRLMGYVEGPSPESIANHRQDYGIWAEKISLFFGCSLAVKNNGTAEATNVSIEFFLPDFISARASDDLPKQPEEPWSNLPSAIMPFNHQPRSPSRPYIRRDGSLSFIIPSLVHNRLLNLHRFYFQFASREAISNFSVRFVITCPEIIDPISSELNFVLPKK